MKFVNGKPRLVSTSLGLLLLIGVSSSQETSRQLHFDFLPSPLRLMSNSFRKISESAKQFIQWGPPATKHKYSTIPSNYDSQQTSYSSPPNYYTLAPVSSVSPRRPSPTQAVKVDYNNNYGDNAYRLPSSNKPISYTGYQQQGTSYSNALRNSYGSSSSISNFPFVKPQKTHGLQRPEEPSHVKVPDASIKDSSAPAQESSSSFGYPVVYDHLGGPHGPPHIPDYHLGWHPPPPPPPPKYIIEIYPPKKGWGWKPKPPKKKFCVKVQQGSEVNISSVADLKNYPGYRFTTVDNVTLDPVALFTPALRKVPVAPSVIKIGIIDKPKGFQVKRMETMVVDMSDKPEGSNNLNMLREVYRFDGGPNNEDIQSARNAGANILSVMTLTYTSPNVSAPLYGYNNSDFKKGLEEIKEKRRNKELPPVLYDLYENQLSVLSDVFNDLQGVERRFYRQKVSTTPQYNYYNAMEVEAPIFDGEVQVWTVPEPDSGEKTILDSVYNFGQPAFRQDFASHDSFINSWISMRELMEKKRLTMDLSQFTSMDNTFESLNERIVRRLRFYRRIAKESFLPQEEDAIKSFKQYQFLAVPPVTNGTCSGPIDPTRQGMDRVIGFGGGSTVNRRRIE